MRLKSHVWPKSASTLLFVVVNNHSGVAWRSSLNQMNQMNIDTVSQAVTRRGRKRVLPFQLDLPAAFRGFPGAVVHQLVAALSNILFLV